MGKGRYDSEATVRLPAGAPPTLQTPLSLPNRDGLTHQMLRQFVIDVHQPKSLDRLQRQVSLSPSTTRFYYTSG